MVAVIDMPRRLRQRPKDHRGFPIPFTTLIVDGKPDFRISDPDRWLTCLCDLRCALCGQTLDEAWFVGGPSCEQSRQFLDPAMHRDCAEFALRTCPFLSMPKGHFSDIERRPPPPGFAMVPGVDPKRPERFMLGRAPGYRRSGGGVGPVIIATAPWLELFWWKDGIRIVQPIPVRAV